MNKYFEGKRVTYANLEKQMLAMKSNPSEDRKKMAALYFLASILVGGRKSGEGASLVDSFFLTVVDDLDACETFPWGRYAFEHNLKDVSTFLEKCDGVAPTGWVFTSFPIPLEVLAFEAIPSLRNHFRENVSGARSGCPRMCKMQYKRKSGTREFSLNAVNDKIATAAEKELLETIGMDKESCWADDDDDAAVDRWTKIIRKGKKQVFFEEQFVIDFEARTSRNEGQAHAKSGQAHADSVEATGATPESAFEVMDGRLMNAVREAMKEVNEKVTSLSHKLALLEEEVKSLRLSDKPANQDAPQKKADQDAPQNEDDESGEDDGSDNKESEEEDGSDSKDGGFIEDVTNENQGGDGDMDDTDAEMYAHAAEFERSLETKKKRPREDDGNEAVRAKSRFSPVGTRSKKAAEKAAAEKAPGKKAPGKKTPGKKAPAKKAAGKKAAGKKAAEEDAAQKKQKTKKTE
ncbi:uncharacterized protein At3g43530-like [Brassica napus]|uniref:uncharacterized protein At3g43530-like n=1 Tax=Brassica napus TaxID=3708 RepID=UPI0006AB45E9|nr:uncharacterized protein At3g43530-like [Brassica napus]